MTDERGGIPRWVTALTLTAMAAALAIAVPAQVRAARQVPTPQGLCVCARVSPTAVKLTWSDAGPLAQSYVLQRSTVSDFSSATSEIVVAKGTLDYVDESQTYAADVWYRIASQAGPDRSAFSEPVRTRSLAGTRPSAPSAPANVGLQDASDGIRITWHDTATNETGMWIQRSADNGSTWEFKASLPANDWAYTDTSPPATAPMYRVWTFNGGGTTASYAVQWVTPRAAAPSVAPSQLPSPTVPSPAVPTVGVPSIPAVPTVGVPALPTLDPQLWFGVKSITANVYIFSLWVLPDRCTGYSGACAIPEPTLCLPISTVIALCYYTRS